MSANKISWKALTAISIAIAMIIVIYSCTGCASSNQDLIIQFPQDISSFSTSSDSGYSVAYASRTSQPDNSDSEILASAGTKTVKLWNPSTGKVIRSFPGQAWVVAFSPNGEVLASGSQDGSLKLWNVTTKELIRTLKHSAAVIDIVFSPDGQTLVSGLDLGSNIKLWNWRTGEIIRIPNDPNSSANSSKRGFDDLKFQPIAISPDGQNLFATSASGSASQLWNLQTGKLIRNFDAKSSINAIAISPDGKTLATGVRDKAIKLWNVGSGELIYTLTGHAGEVMSVAFAPDGQTLASGSWDKTIKLWNLTTGKLIRTFPGHKEKVWSVAFSPDGKTLASGSQDGIIKIWRLL
ncbi:WD-repeat protein [Nostoc sp. NIES-4103]|nr:WD-repeat protein [Nostoc sp. NIES-4103]